VNLAGETFTAEAAQKVIDASPVLIGLQGVDSALEGAEAYVKGKLVTTMLQASVALSKFATMYVDAVLIYKGKSGTEQANIVGAATEATNSIIETLAKTSGCSAALYNKDYGDMDSCFDAVSKAVDTVVALHPDTLAKKEGGMMNKDTFKEKLQLVSDGVSMLASEWKYVTAESPDDAKRALFGIAGSIVKMARDTAFLVYASKGEEVPTTGWQAHSLQLLDNVATPLLTLGEKCYGKAANLNPATAAIKIAQCGSASVQESLKAGIKGVMAGVGSVTGIYTIGAYTNLLVAQVVMEEMLRVGNGNLSNLYRKYGVKQGAYYSAFDLVEVIGAETAHGSLYNSASVVSIVDAYMMQINHRVYLDMNSAAITLIATNDTLLGGVSVQSTVSPDMSKGFSVGELVCYATDSSNSDHPLSNPLQAHVNGVTKSSFKFNFTTGGYKTITCALYRGNGLFDGSKSVDILMPPNFSFMPETPTAGSKIKFTAGAKGSITSYSWDFGDGFTDSSSVLPKAITSHAYMKAGTYTVKLTVMDGWQSVTVEKTIVVAESLDDDHDGIPDWWEIQYGLDPKVNDATTDKDSDGLSNLDEYKAKTDPTKSDTDGDGFTDKQELDANSDPLDKTKYPDLTLSAPQNIKVVEGDGKVTLSWDTVKGAATYQVCNDSSWNEFGSYGTRSCESNKPYGARWQSTASSTITLTALPDGSPLLNGTTYGLTVFAQDTNGKDGLGAEIDVTPKKIATTIGKLNDTGITTCSNATTNGLPCPQAGFPGQDAESGRDANQATNNDADGHAGFSFTKISRTGQELPASATEWSCVKDNVTGLMWEVKTDDGGLHDKDWTYTWYEPDNTKNGGHTGTQNGGICSGTSACDTFAYVQAVKAAGGWCGANDWRMPSVTELHSIADLSGSDQAIDTAYFPNASYYGQWSGTPYAEDVSVAYAWGVSGGEGYVGYYESSSRFFVRLVRASQ